MIFERKLAGIEPYKTMKQKQEGRFSIEYCKKILNKSGDNYTNEEVIKIREFLYFIAEMEHENFLEQKQENVTKPSQADTLIP
jgi:hypothetical protein